MPAVRSSLPATAAEYHPRGPAGSAPRLVMVFVDGVGLAPAGRGNPLTAAATPTLRRLLGGPLTAERAAGGASSAAAGATEAGGTVALAALDASLEVEGLPQSATGQTTLFTGVNAAAAVGRHVSAFPGPRLRAADPAARAARPGCARPATGSPSPTPTRGAI